LPAGEVALRARFDYDEHTGLGKGGLLTLFIDQEQVAEGRIEKTVPFIYSMSGETMDVGIDTGAPVGPYHHEFPFTGTIRRIDIEVGKLLDALPPDKRDELMASGLGHAALASQ
jgi:arylsulfatase